MAPVHLKVYKGPGYCISAPVRILAVSPEVREEYPYFLALLLIVYTDIKENFNKGEVRLR
jgi:hypothetical protein